MKLIKYITAILLLILTSCDFNIKRQVPKKPFIIIYKYPESQNCKNKHCGYKYISSDGMVQFFCEDVESYNIGDTIH